MTLFDPMRLKNEEAAKRYTPTDGPREYAYLELYVRSAPLHHLIL